MSRTFSGIYTLEYSPSCCDRINSIVCFGIDIFLSPFVCMVFWNTVLTNIFSIKQISYVYCLLFKCVIMFFIRDGACGTLYYSQSDSIQKMYVNAIYEKLYDIENTVRLQIYQNVNRREEGNRVHIQNLSPMSFQASNV